MEKSALKHPKFFNRYVDKVAHGDLNVLLAQSFQDLQNDLAILKQADFDYAYQPDKWTIGKLIRHCIDTEQIFGYRALCIARLDPNPIISFDENQFADASGNSFDKNDLLEAMELSRKQNVLLFKSFDTEWLIRNNKTSSGDDMSLVSLAYIIIGHWLHHKSILTSRYGIEFP
ncbi:MAG: hypothetical protein RI991_322 [Bacteroidota bacterium]